VARGLVVGCWLLVVGCWLLVVGCWLLVVGCWFGLLLHSRPLWLSPLREPVPESGEPTARVVGGASWGRRERDEGSVVVQTSPYGWLQRRLRDAEKKIVDRARPCARTLVKRLH
jgi:hypothetical protein